MHAKEIMSMILAALWLIPILSYTQSSNNGLGFFKEDILAAHNKNRADLNIATLMWSDELALMLNYGQII